MTYHVGQIVTVELPIPRGTQRVTGTVANRLPADLFEHSVLVVVDDLSGPERVDLLLRYGERYVGWFAPEQLDQWQDEAA